MALELKDQDTAAGSVGGCGSLGKGGGLVCVQEAPGLCSEAHSDTCTPFKIWARISLCAW